MDGLAGAPDVFQRQIADIAPGKAHRRQRRAALHGAVRFQRDHRLARGASVPVHALVAEAAPQMLVRAVVTDVVADIHQQPAALALLVEPREQRHQLSNWYGWSSSSSLSTALPMATVSWICQCVAPSSMMVSIRAGRSGMVCAPIWLFTLMARPAARRALEGIHGPVERAGHIAHLVVQRRQPVERDADSVESGLDGLLQPLGRQVAPAGLDGAVHAVGVDRPDQLGPVLAQIGFATDQRDLPRAQPRQRFDDLQALLGIEFVRSPAPGARAAMQAFEVTGQGDFPDHVNGTYRWKSSALR